MTESMIALITGANKGIGREIVRSLAERGMTVLLGARDPERREKAAAALRADGLDVHPIALDVTDPATIGAAAAHVDERFGRLDVLVNNAGTAGGVHHPPSEADLDVVREVFDTNVFGVIRVTNAMLPLLGRSATGRIINVSSDWGSMTRTAELALPAHVDYPTSKAALNALTVQYAIELREHGIAVNAVAPGLCATDFSNQLGFPIPRTAAQGAAIAVRLATLEGDGPTGRFFDDDGEVPW
ncbi:SDR family oxidoreductase [Nonomuraea muscovyensis]|jgi:NAD(P)-dependent dehydrogenase (short-subunit alcohol dehydrogenase family)|uniref:NAD(P)-dependent dehydrogenase (Short-subunit alcohol dehydrogenase family) n=1 Tax=Nonomuraea muscovyensis TaxID=1124761 RepID=A0A7X0C5L1_9ACTN|nr:SDR family oxidoreductase [Nonomuraea muscovyensis]MBB6347129.1 NAD(P)-dependent dehydrogenase (short-subunit alcohol dehydrogenase family) [Nonomuraea muscovyensis]